MKSTLISTIALISAPVAVSGYAFVSSVHQSSFQTSRNKNLKSLCNHQSITRTSTTSLQMVDQQVLMGAGVAIAGLAAGIGMVAFTENQVCLCCFRYLYKKKLYLSFDSYILIILLFMIQSSCIYIYIL